MKVVKLASLSASPNMQLSLNYALASLALLAPNALALLRFSCSQLVVERLDPLVNPGVTGSPHLHQVIGGVCEQWIHRTRLIS